MKILVSKAGQEHEWNDQTWARVQKLASQYGWKPKGDVSASISDEDARALADALESSLKDVPNQGAANPSDDENDSNLVQWFGGGHKEDLKQFIAFCRPGAFYIDE